MWGYILKEQVAPIRWTMKMWTRFNIAEPSIRNMIEHFENDWNLITTSMAELPMEEIREKLAWEDFDDRLAH